MNSAVAIFERLLSGDDQQKEHVLETASPHLSDAQGKLFAQVDKMVGEIGAVFGAPDFSATPTPEDKVKTSLPSWSVGTPKNGGTVQTLRLVYWKRPESTFYIVVRTETHPQKDKKMYYDLVLGAKRRNPEAALPKVDRLRNTKEHWLNKVLPFFTGR
jgi:hypothetical protein